MKISNMLMVLSLGMIGGIVLVECCPKVKELAEKGKQMFAKKQQ